MASTISHCRSIRAEPAYAARRARERAERRARAERTLSSATTLAFAAGSAISTRAEARWPFLLVALLCHASLGYAAVSASVSPQPRAAERVRVSVVEAPRPALDTSREPTVPRDAPPEPKSTSPAPKQAAQKRVTAPKAPRQPAASESPTPQTVVGLTLESTATGAIGPVFAVGETLSGVTAREATALTPVHDSTRAEPEGARPRAPSRNRIAAPLAGPGVRVEPAKRLSRVEPDYPPLQRSQGIEADVTLRLELSPRGEVLRVEIVRSADPDFDRSALAAAERERFSPETHDGQPVPTVITYSYRFRITP